MAASRFTQSEIKRGVKAMLDCGVTMGAVVIRPDGAVRFEFETETLGASSGGWDEAIDKSENR